MTLFRGSALVALFLALSSLAATAVAQIALPPDEKQTRGTQVPDVTLIGEDSTSFALSTLAGKPVVVNPVFTSCQQTCPMITANLRGTLGEIGEPGVGYQVLTISFDPADGPAQLREYRQKLDLPPGWKLAVATPENRKALLDAIDFNYEALPEGGFVHPNVVAILTPTLNVSSYAHGVTYDTKEMRLALEKATRQSSLVWHYRPYILAAAVIAWASVTAVLYNTRKKKRAETA
jgi:protein SCO1/2